MNDTKYMSELPRSSNKAMRKICEAEVPENSKHNNMTRMRHPSYDHMKPTGFVRYYIIKSLILAQDERWRRA